MVYVWMFLWPLNLSCFWGLLCRIGDIARLSYRFPYSLCTLLLCVTTRCVQLHILGPDLIRCLSFFFFFFFFFFLRCQSSNSVLRRKSSNAPLTQTIPGFESGCAAIPCGWPGEEKGPGVHPSMLHPLFPLPAQYMKLYTRPHPRRGSKQHPLVVCCSVYFVYHCISMNSPASLLIH